MAAAFAVRLHTDEVMLARTFRLRGRLYDVYVAADQKTLNRHLERPDFLGIGGDD